MVVGATGGRLADFRRSHCLFQRVGSGPVYVSFHVNAFAFAPHPRPLRFLS